MNFMTQFLSARKIGTIRYLDGYEHRLEIDDLATVTPSSPERKYGASRRRFRLLQRVVVDELQVGLSASTYRTKRVRVDPNIAKGNQNLVVPKVNEESRNGANESFWY